MPRKDPDKDLEYNRQYRAEHLEQARAAGREWYRRNADEQNEKSRKRYEASRTDEAALEKRREKARRHYAKHRERLLEVQRNRPAAKREQYNTNRRIRHAENPEVSKANMLKTKYDITPEDYHRMLVEQCGCCAMCGKQSTNLVIDHCHTEGHVRALLCNTCNAGLGFHEMPGFNEMAEGYKASHTKEKMQCLKAN